MSWCAEHECPCDVCDEFAHSDEGVWPIRGRQQAKTVEPKTVAECDAVGEQLRLRLAAIEEVQSAARGLDVLSKVLTAAALAWAFSGYWLVPIAGRAVFLFAIVFFVVNGSLVWLETLAMRAMMRRVNKRYPMPEAVER